MVGTVETPGNPDNVFTFNLGVSNNVAWPAVDPIVFGFAVDQITKAESNLLLFVAPGRLTDVSVVSVVLLDKMEKRVPFGL